MKKNNTINNNHLLKKIFSKELKKIKDSLIINTLGCFEDEIKDFILHKIYDNCLKLDKTQSLRCYLNEEFVMNILSYCESKIVTNWFIMTL